jgi:hypothetical protein
LQVRQQIAVEFHGIEMGQLCGQHARERAFARPDLDYMISGPRRQCRDDAADDMAVMQEMLAETLFRTKGIHLIENFTGFTGLSRINKIKSKTL